jgi:hypothetical protein
MGLTSVCERPMAEHVLSLADAHAERLYDALMYEDPTVEALSGTFLAFLNDLAEMVKES